MNAVTQISMMKALVYQGPGKIAFEDHPKPQIIDPTDAIIRMTKTTICGTDLHILKGDLPSCEPGRILGHEGVGIIETVGPAVTAFKAGDRVLISCVSACGRCEFCRKGMFSHCTTGGWILGNTIDGTQAEFVRTPHADSSLYPIPEGADEEALVMLSDAARQRIDSTTSTSFACDLKKWLQIMETYEGGGHAYHATLPTDALTQVRNVMLETRARGFALVRAQQQQLGEKVRMALVNRGFKSVAAPGFQAPGVVVSYTDDAGIHSSKAFAALGLQTAAGVPLQCDEPADFKTFRIGLFGLDKLADVDGAVARLEAALGQVTTAPTAAAPAPATARQASTVG